MNNEQAKAAALSWHGQAGGELLPQLTANELSGIVNEAIQQAAVPEGWRIDLTQLYRRAEVYSSIAASPHHMTFTIEALRNLIEEFASPSPPKQQPDHLAGGECGGVQS